MASQTDLDQGGTSRQWVRTYLGPSVGWIYVPEQSVLTAVIAGGTYTLYLSTTLVTVNAAGLVNVILPSCVSSSAGPQAQPGTFAQYPVTVVDIGGNAGTYPITIYANNGSETIMGLPTIQILSNYGGFVLRPNSALRTWTTT